MNLRLNRTKINVKMAEKCLTAKELAEQYGVSRNRMSIILDKREVTPNCAGRLAKALGCDVTEIIEQ